MPLTPLPFRSPLEAYAAQADALLEGWRAHDPDAMRFVREHHPRFLDERLPWLPKRLSDDEVRSVALDRSDARLAGARGYSFQDWERLAEWVEAVAQDGSPVARFESAVEAVIEGDLPALERRVREDPGLIRSRSTVVTHHDPPVHGATLLHYVAANGVEGYRQKSPKNAVEVATMLLEAGAEPDALAGMYGGQCTTMSLLVSSSPPVEAGVQVALVDILVDHGAAVEDRGFGPWTSPLMTALAFWFRDAAEALVRRGARVRTLAAAAGLGRVAEARRLLEAARPEDRHRALVLSAQHGHPEVVRLLVERGARLDIRDTLYQGTPLGWAEYGGRAGIAAWLRSRGAAADA